MDKCLFMFTNYAGDPQDGQILASLSIPAIPAGLTQELVAELCCVEGFSFRPFYSHAKDSIETSSRIVAHLTTSIVRENKDLISLPIDSDGFRTIVSSTIAIVSAILDHGNKQQDGWEAELVDSKILRYASDATTIFIMIPVSEAKKYIGVGHNQEAIDYFDYICLDLFLIICLVLDHITKQYVSTMTVPKSATIN